MTQLKKVRKQMLDDFLKNCPFVFVDSTNPYSNDTHLTKITFNMSKLKLDLTTNDNTCKDCHSFTKQDEWANYEARICIDCNSVNEQDAWEDYQQRKADTMQP